MLHTQHVHDAQPAACEAHPRNSVTKVISRERSNLDCAAETHVRRMSSSSIRPACHTAARTPEGSAGSDAGALAAELRHTTSRTAWRGGSATRGWGGRLLSSTAFAAAWGSAGVAHDLHPIAQLSRIAWDRSDPQSAPASHTHTHTHTSKER